MVVKKSMITALSINMYVKPFTPSFKAIAMIIEIPPPNSTHEDKG